MNIFIIVLVLFAISAAGIGFKCISVKVSEEHKYLKVVLEILANGLMYGVLLTTIQWFLRKWNVY